MQGETSLTIAANHPAFAGHFPDRPIVPGVLLLDAALHAVVQARQSADEPVDCGPSGGCQIASAKFLSPVLPGETLTIAWIGTSGDQTRFDITGRGRKVATGTFTFGTSE